MTKFREAFPLLAVDNVARAASFYADTFGFEEKYRFPPEGDPDFVFLALPPLGIGLGPRREGEPDYALCVYTDDADSAADALRAARAEEVAAPADRAWDERMTMFRDHDGHLLVVLGPIS
jgi:uncharacterized glyoxalase superfamily protein PhnB